MRFVFLSAEPIMSILLTVHQITVFWQYDSEGQLERVEQLGHVFGELRRRPPDPHPQLHRPAAQLPGRLLYRQQQRHAVVQHLSLCR